MNSEMSPERMKEIRERVEKATAGEWIAFLGKVGVSVYCVESPGCQVRIYDAAFDPGCIKETHERQRADAKFIAAARQDIPDLLAEVERLRAAPLPLNSTEAVFAAADERFHQLSAECLADDTSSQDFFRNGYANGVNDVGQRLRAVATRHNLILDDKIDIVQVVVDELDILHGDSTMRVPRTPYEVWQEQDRQYWADKAVGALKQLAAERARRGKPDLPQSRTSYENLVLSLLAIAKQTGELAEDLKRSAELAPSLPAPLGQDGKK